MTYFVDLQFKDLSDFKIMVEYVKGLGSPCCIFSISPSKIEMIGMSQDMDMFSVYVYSSYEISRYDQSNENPVRFQTFTIPPSSPDAESVCFKVMLHNLAHAVEYMSRITITNVHMKLRESGEKWILLFQNEDFSSQKELFVLPETFPKSEPTIGSFNVDMVLSHFFKVHCVCVSMKTFNERIRISANNQGQLKLESGQLLFNLVSCFNNCINYMDSVEVLDDDYFKFATVDIDSAYLVKFFNVVKDYDIKFKFKIVDNFALLFEGEKDYLKVKLFLPAKHL